MYLPVAPSGRESESHPDPKRKRTPFFSARTACRSDACRSGKRIPSDELGALERRIVAGGRKEEPCCERCEARGQVRPILENSTACTKSMPNYPRRSTLVGRLRFLWIETNVSRYSNFSQTNSCQLITSVAVGATRCVVLLSGGSAIKHLRRF